MSEEYGEYTGDNEKAKFNMAIDTLKRLGIILIDIKDNSNNIESNTVTNQLKKINLTKSFYIHSAPLLSKDFKEENGEKLLKCKLNNKKHIQNRSGRSGIIMGEYPVYDFDLDFYLDNILVMIQEDLASKGMFMPPKETEAMF